MKQHKADGWQSVTDAVKRAGCSKQNLYQLVRAQRIPSMKMWGVILVPDPLPHEVDRAKRNRAKASAS